LGGTPAYLRHLREDGRRITEPGVGYRRLLEYFPRWMGLFNHINGMARIKPMKLAAKENAPPDLIDLKDAR
jgi:hypothetical protein